MKIHWSNGQVADIELIKNDFVEYWHSIAAPMEAANKRIDTWHWHEIPHKDMPDSSDARERERTIGQFNDHVDDLAEKFDIHFPGKMYHDQPQAFLNKIEMCSLTANLGDSRTIVSHPATTTHSKLSPEDRLEVGITDGLVRLSIGLENIKDIIADIDQALDEI